MNNMMSILFLMFNITWGIGSFMSIQYALKGDNEKFSKYLSLMFASAIASLIVAVLIKTGGK